MPTFTAIALDRLLEPGTSKSVDMPVPSGKSSYSKPPIPKLEKRSTKPARQEKKTTYPQMSPALYATPEAIPVPNSPSSFPPSPYIINHKARGPRLLKSFSEDLSSCHKTLDEKNSDGDADIKGGNLRKSASETFTIPQPSEKNLANGVCESPTNGIHENLVTADTRDGEFGSGKVELRTCDGVVGSNDERIDLERENETPNFVAATTSRDGEFTDFYDPSESVNLTSNSELGDDADASSLKDAFQTGEFYDAWEELSSDSGMQTSVRNVEAELSEIRLSLLMEIEKRKHAEEGLNNMRMRWQQVRQQLAQVGINLPSDYAALADGEESISNLAEELCHRFDIARFVSDSIGRGVEKAKAEMELEAIMEAKNFEIARLSDRLHYYEAVNREMSQRNQEAIEVARRERQRRKRRQRWVWGSIAATITLGSTALAWSYLPPGKSPSPSQAADNDG